MRGTLYCLPNLIADDTLNGAIAPLVRERACAIRYFLAEAAKTTRAYLKLLGHPGPIAELTITEIGHDPEPACVDAWLAPVLAGQDAAVVSESGCPGIADPGAQIVARAQDLGIRVVPLVGPSSILMTLMASGLDGQRFRFLGYLPIDQEERRQSLKALEADSRPLVGPSSILMTLMASGLDGQRFRFLGYLPIDQEERRQSLKALEADSRRSETQLFIETPYRNQQMLTSLLDTLSPSTRVTVATDITGTRESIRTMTVQAWKGLPEEARQLPKLPTVFAFLAAPSGEAPRYAPSASHHKGHGASASRRQPPRRSTRTVRPSRSSR